MQVADNWIVTVFFSAVAIVFLFSFLVSLHFLKKKSYSLLAASHVLSQLLIVVACYFLVASFRPVQLSNTNSSSWFIFTLVGFLISAIISETSYSLVYLRTGPAHLTPIEVLLSKTPKTDEDATPSFLRLGGFLWVDFEKDILIKRQENQEIIARIKTEKSLMLIGDQASGKSSILRHVGYLLANKGFIVFFVNADSLDVNLALG